MNDAAVHKTVQKTPSSLQNSAAHKNPLILLGTEDDIPALKSIQVSCYFLRTFEFIIHCSFLCSPSSKIIHMWVKLICLSVLIYSDCHEAPKYWTGYYKKYSML